LKKEFGGDIETGFSSIFWNTSWTNGQAPHTLGILCNPKHPALKEFPTQYFSNWQWWDAMSHSNSIIMDSLSKNLQPIVRVIDDWVTARPLGLLFECKAGKGKLLVSGIDLISNNDKRGEARQLQYSLEKYMSSGSFNPAVTIAVDTIRRMIN
ncbi:MAG: beta-galactosidase, partial [Ferruginibacter sp.]|nr:beta-galactosidase [Ferruginibacter sp.]